MFGYQFVETFGFDDDVYPLMRIIVWPLYLALAVELTYTIRKSQAVVRVGPSGTRSFLWPDHIEFGFYAKTESKLLTDTNEHMDENSADARLVKEEGLDAVVASVIAPPIEDLGFRLVRARMFDHNGLTMQIMAERPDGTMSVNDCEAVSRAISPVLDVEDPVSQAYNLEISSPGIDRPLVRRSDFETWAGHTAKIESAYLVEGRKRWRGLLVKLEGDDLILRRDNAAKGEEVEARIPLQSISAANLILTDELVREALKRDKALRTANDINDDDLDTDN